MNTTPEIQEKKLLKALRKGDEVTSLAEQINHLIADFRGKISTLQDALGKAQEGRGPQAEWLGVDSLSSSDVDPPPADRTRKCQHFPIIVKRATWLGD